MKSCTALRLDKDHDLTANILPEVYFRCTSLKDFEFPWMSKAYARQQTEIRVAWTTKFLYVHFWALDSFVTAKETKPKGKVYLDDCLELLVQPEPDAYFGWEVNALGTLLEYQVSGWKSAGSVTEAQFDYQWKTSALWKARRHDAGWVLELKIPFEKDLGRAPSRGDVWPITFNRVDVDNRGNESLSTWSELPSEPVWFHQPQGFGELHFG